MRWRRRKDERPDEILEAALDCFIEYGFTATRLDEVADRAGVSKGTLYLYFSSKEEIFKSVVREKIVANFANLEKILESENISAAESFKQLFGFIVKLITASKAGAIPKLIISESGNFPSLVRFYHQEVISRGAGIIEGILRRGIKAGEFRAVDVEQTIYSIISPALFAMIWKHSFEPHVTRRIDIENLFQNHLEFVLYGLKKEK